MSILFCTVAVVTWFSNVDCREEQAHKKYVHMWRESKEILWLNLTVKLYITVPDTVYESIPALFLPKPYPNLGTPDTHLAEKHSWKLCISFFFVLKILLCMNSTQCPNSLIVKRGLFCVSFLMWFCSNSIVPSFIT